MRGSDCALVNPVKAVKRPQVKSYEGKTPALGDHQLSFPHRQRVTAIFLAFHGFFL